MADEGAALDALYKAATNLVDCKAKLAKEAVDTFPEVHSRADHHLANAAGPCMLLPGRPERDNPPWERCRVASCAVRPASMLHPAFPARAVRSTLLLADFLICCPLQHAADFQALLDNAKVGPKCKTLALQVPPLATLTPGHANPWPP